MSYVIRTAEFEGPLDVLASLIHKRKLLINDISLAEVAEGYISYINSFESKSIDNISDFISIATTLLLIKSKSLLPEIDLSYEEEHSIDELKERLKHYDTFIRLSDEISSLYGKTPIYLPIRKMGKEHVSLNIPGNLNLEEIKKHTKNILNSIPHFYKKTEIRIKQIISLKDVIDNLEKRLESGFSSTFKNFVGNDTEKSSIVVNFLALLELVKKGTLEVTQKEHFHDILLESNNLSTPKYGQHR